MKSFWKANEEILIGAVVLTAFIAVCIGPMFLTTMAENWKRHTETEHTLQWEKQKYLGDQLREMCFHKGECEAYQEFQMTLKKEASN